MTEAERGRTDGLHGATDRAAGSRAPSGPGALADVPLDVLGRGDVLAERFRIDALTAVGGMATVYRGFDLQAKVPVAIKVIAKRGDASDNRFSYEAAVLATLSHPSIVRYVDHQINGRRAFLVMEWLEGEDLAARLARKGLSIDETLRVGRAVAAGLAAAHARGIVHRDVKPSNVFLAGCAVDAVKLLDFGVARDIAAPRRLTRAGSMLGTVGYMAPEQAKGEPDVDARADVFALGCLLYECLTGTPAFSGQHEMAVLAKVLRDEPAPVSTLRPELGDALDPLLACLLAKDPAVRPRDAAAVLELLSKLPDGLDGGVVAARVPARGGPISAERRILSVILGRPPRRAQPTTVPEEPSERESLEALCQRFGAESIPLQGGALLMLLAGDCAATAADQAVQAARCALRLRQLRPDLELSVATGGVETAAPVPVGAAIDRAAALLASPVHTSSVWIDPLTSGLLGTRFAVEPTRGGARRLLAEVEEREELGVLMGRTTPFVGRAKELGLLLATLDECVEDEVCRAVLVTGAPGAGKSRLGREFLEKARSSGRVRVLVARAEPVGAGSALSLVTRLIRSAAELRSGEANGTQRARLAAYVACLVGPEERVPLTAMLAEILGIGAPQVDEPLVRAARGDPEVMREQKRRAFDLFMRAEVARGPLVVVLEDLHWGDLPSVSYLQETLRTLAHKPLFVLASARPEVHACFPRIRDFTNLEEVRLSGLTRRASEQLVRQLLPEPTDKAVVDKIVALASGNAFYLEELVRRVADGGTELPETVIAMVQSRLDRLPAEARRVLRAASIFGETAWVSGVDALLSGTLDTAGLFTFLAEEEVLVRRPDSHFPGESEYGFRHALLREAAYAMLTDADRKAGHLRAAEWLEGRGEREALVLAEHFEQGGARERAIPWLVRASVAASDGGDFESAIALSERGTALGARGEERGMLLLVRAHASVWRSAPELPDEALALLPRGAASWWLALSLHVFGPSMLGEAERASPYLTLALETSSEVDLTGAYAQAIKVLAVGAALVGRAEIGWTLVRHLEQAMAAADRPADPAFLAYFELTRCVLASNALVNGGWALGRALAFGRESIAMMRRVGSASGETEALFHVGAAYSLLGAQEEAQSLLQQSLKLARQTGNLLTEQHAEYMLAVFALRGPLRSEAVSTLHGFLGSSNAQLAHGAEAMLAEQSCHEGRLDEALVRATRAMAGPALLHRCHAGRTLARVYASTGRPREALEAVARVCADAGPVAFPQYTLDLACLRAEALLALGEREAGRRAIAQAAAFRVRLVEDIEDAALRKTFLSRVRANRVLDRLAGQWLEAESAVPRL